MSDEHRVLGYVHLADRDDDRLAVGYRDIQDCCQRHGLRLFTVFYDYYRGVEASDRAAFVEVLRGLGDPNVTAVVVPDLSHLSPEGTVRRALTDLITAAGGQVLVARETPREVVAPGLGLHVWLGDGSQEQWS
jgi:hypothetical protein